MLIECYDPSSVISILCAFYGIDPNIKCSGLNSTQLPTACFSQSSQTRVSSECNGKRECSFSGEISFEIDSGFVNPCPGYQNMLFVQWECVNAASVVDMMMMIDGMEESTTTSQPSSYDLLKMSGAMANGTQLPICKDETPVFTFIFIIFFCF